MFHILFHLAIDIKLYNGWQFFPNFEPVFPLACHIHIIDATAGEHPVIVEIGFEWVHDDGCGDDFIDAVGGWEITLEESSGSLHSLFFYQLDDLGEEAIPIVFH